MPMPAFCKIGNYLYGKGTKMQDNYWETNSVGFLVLPLPQAATGKGGGDQRARRLQGWRHLETHLVGSGITWQAQTAKASLEK